MDILVGWINVCDLEMKFGQVDGGKCQSKGFWGDLKKLGEPKKLGSRETYNQGSFGAREVERTQEI